MIVEDGLEARSHKIGTECQYCGDVMADKKVLRSFHFLTFVATNSLQPSPSSVMANTNVRQARYRGYLSQSIVSCLRLSVTLTIPYVRQQAQCKNGARVGESEVALRCREMIEATLQSRCRICGFQRLANLPVSHGTQLS